VTHFEAIVPWHGEFPGRASVPRFFQAIANSVDVTAFVPKEFIAQGDTVVSLGDFGCRVRATGKTAQSSWVFIWKFREGRVHNYAALTAAFR
jgi:ketosteroid isomerase-like protein